MKKNLGTSGRILRLCISCILFLAAWSSSSFILLAFALFTLYEALASWCILYQLVGLNYCPLDKNNKQH